MASMQSFGSLDSSSRVSGESRLSGGARANVRENSNKTAHESTASCRSERLGRALFSFAMDSNLSDDWRRILHDGLLATGVVCANEVAFVRATDTPLLTPAIDADDGFVKESDAECAARKRKHVESDAGASDEVDAHNSADLRVRRGERAAAS